MVNLFIRKRKLVFTRKGFCDKMYLVKIGHFEDINQKFMGKMQIITEFLQHFFVVFYQLFFCPNRCWFKI